jgi:hypothetical protein
VPRAALEKLLQPDRRPQEDLAPLPVREVIDSPAKLAAAKQRLATLEQERDRLIERRKKLGTRFLPQDDDRLRYLQGETYTLSRETTIASHMTGAPA